MAKYRLQFCFDCELRRGVFCGECGCELHAKSEIEDEKCPHPKGNKWGRRMRYLDGGLVGGELKSKDCKLKTPRQLPITGGLNVFA